MGNRALKNNINNGISYNDTALNSNINDLAVYNNIYEFKTGENHMAKMKVEYAIEVAGKIENKTTTIDTESLINKENKTLEDYAIISSYNLTKKISVKTIK